MRTCVGKMCRGREQRRGKLARSDEKDFRRRGGGVDEIIGARGGEREKERMREDE